MRAKVGQGVPTRRTDAHQGEQVSKSRGRTLPVVGMDHAGLCKIDGYELDNYLGEYSLLKHEHQATVWAAGMMSTF